MGSRGAFEIAQFSSPFMRVVDVGNGRVIDQACQEAFQSSVSNSVNPKKRSLAAITAVPPPPPPTSRPRRQSSSSSSSSSSSQQTSQILPPPPPSSKRKTNPDDFTISAPISRERVMSMRGGATQIQPSQTMQPSYVPPSRPYQPHHTASMLAPSVIVDASRNAVTVPPMNLAPPPPPMMYPQQQMQPMMQSPFMSEANRLVGKVPLVFFFVMGTLIGMLGAMAVVTAMNTNTNDAGGASKKATTNISATPQQHQPVSIRANRLFVYPLVMTTERAPEGANNVHGRTASSRLSANAGR
jgi:hypothetical protein